MNKMLARSTILKLPIDMPVFAGAKNSASQWIWTTQTTVSLFNYVDTDELLGLNDSDIESTKDFAELLVKNDQSTMASGQNTFIETTRIGPESKVVQAICTKTPLHDEDNNICGIFWLAIPIVLSDQQSILQSISDSLKPIYGTKEQRLQVASPDLPHKLSSRELEVLFYTLRGKSAKNIAQCLNISPRTVETHIIKIKEKFSCTTKQQLIDAAIAKGYMTLIPNTLFQPSLPLIA